MKKLKSIVSCALAFCCLLSFVGCNGEKVTPNNVNAYTYNPYFGEEYAKDTLYNYKNGGIYGMLNGVNNDYQDFNNTGKNSQNKVNQGGNSGESEQVNQGGNSGESEQINKPVVSDAPYVKWETSRLVAPGDEFTLPNVTQCASAPVIAELTKQVNPGSSVTVMGEGFSAANTKAYYIANNGIEKLAKSYVVTDQQIVVTIDASEEYGVYGIYIKNNNGTSAIKTVNKPIVWWNSWAEVNAGDEFYIYGENLTTENGNSTNVYLIDGAKHYKMPIIKADPNRVAVQIPKGLVNDKKYSIKLHNGHGGETGWADISEKIIFKEYLINAGTGKIVNVVDYGASTDGKSDAGQAVRDAVAAANEGDTIYFPKGKYLIQSEVYIDKSLKIIGEGADKTNFVTDGKTKNELTMIKVKVGPCEITGISFEDLRTTTKLDTGFITIDSDEYMTDSYNLYVHDCKFIQSVDKRLLSKRAAIIVARATNIVIENNYFEVTQAIFSDYASRMFIRNNEMCGICYCGTYYDQNNMLIWHSDMVDVSGNKVYGKDLLVDSTRTLEIGDQTIGRFLVFQTANKNLYVSYNDLKNVGLVDDNAGEQILFEHVGEDYNGSVVSAANDKVIIADHPNNRPTGDSLIIITKGKGLGQYRKVKSYRNKEVTIEGKWDIVPDSTSKVSIITSFENVVVHNNNIDGHLNFAETNSATLAVQIYCQMVNCYVTKNYITNISGIGCVSIVRESASDVAYWITIDNNHLNNARSIGVVVNGMRKNNTPNAEILFISSYGVSIRNNVFENFRNIGPSKGAAITVGCIHNSNQFPDVWNGSWAFGTVIENNKFYNMEVEPIIFRKHQGHTVLRGNEVDGEMNIYALDQTNSNIVVIAEPLLYEQN